MKWVVNFLGSGHVNEPAPVSGPPTFCPQRPYPLVGKSVTTRSPGSRSSGGSRYVAREPEPKHPQPVRVWTASVLVVPPAHGADAVQLKRRVGRRLHAAAEQGCGWGRRVLLPHCPPRTAAPCRNGQGSPQERTATQTRIRPLTLDMNTQIGGCDPDRIVLGWRLSLPRPRSACRPPRRRLWPSPGAYSPARSQTVAVSARPTEYRGSQSQSR